MPRPTPARILYLLIGLLLGLAGTIAVQVLVVPSLLASLPFGGTPTPVPVTGPAQFTSQTLERVGALNMSQDRGGVAVRLNALELFRDGVTITYSLTSGRAGASPQTIEPETFVLTDDRGTVYTLTPLGTSAVASAGLTTGMASFTPAPPPEARSLRLTVPNALALGLRPREGQSRVISGPWEFQLPLRG
jgi:hypothetical protein